MPPPNPTGKGLIPAKPGEVRNPNGKPKGTLDMATRIKRIMNSDIDWSKINIKDTTKLQERYGKDAVATALIYVQISKALTGDTNAFNALNRVLGYQDEQPGQINVVHIFKPEKLSIDELNDEGDRLRKHTRDILEAEVIDDQVASPTGSADNSLTGA